MRWASVISLICRYININFIYKSFFISLVLNASSHMSLSTSERIIMHVYRIIQNKWKKKHSQSFYSSNEFLSIIVSGDSFPSFSLSNDCFRRWCMYNGFNTNYLNLFVTTSGALIGITLYNLQHFNEIYYKSSPSILNMTGKNMMLCVACVLYIIIRLRLFL